MPRHSISISISTNAATINAATAGALLGRVTTLENPDRSIAELGAVRRCQPARGRLTRTIAERDAPVG